MRRSVAACHIYLFTSRLSELRNWLVNLRMIFLVVVFVLPLTIASTVLLAPPPQNVWCDTNGGCGSLSLLAEFNSVDYNWTGSPITKEDALAVGSYIAENSIITGVSAYKTRLFICVPRWRSGVPSTLNELTFNATTGAAVLTPFPSWAWQSTHLHNIQAVHIDQTSGMMFVVDAGRENFYDSNALQTTINRAASLIVLTIPDLSDNKAIVVSHNITFPDSILPYNSSFLNDIRVDSTGIHVFMTDMNTLGHGAIIAMNLETGFQRRFECAETRIQPGFTVNVGGVDYPSIQAPVDGIAISKDDSVLYFSALTGSIIYSVPTAALLDADMTNSDIALLVKIVLDKGTASDGMDVASDGTSGAILFGGLSTNSVMRVGCGNVQTKNENATIGLSSSRVWLDWIDTIIAVSPYDVYFTTNRLPAFLTWAMDFSGGSGGANMRVFHMRLAAGASGAAVPDETSSGVPTNAVVAMSVLASGTLGLVVAAVVTRRWRDGYRTHVRTPLKSHLLLNS